MTNSPGVKSFVIVQGDDRSTDVQELAKLLGSLPSKAQDLLFDTFGFKLEVRDGFQLHTHPSRVGFGTLRYGSQTANIVVLPKVSFDIESVFDLIGAADLPNKPTPEQKVVLRDLQRIRSEGPQIADWLRHTRDAVTLHSIADVARRGRNQTHRSQDETLRSRFRGRLNVNEYARNSIARGQLEHFPVTHLSVGKFSLQDEVLANTARRIGSVYDPRLLHANPILRRDLSSAKVLFADVPRRALTLRDVIAASRPPYPFGYAHALLAARNYWLDKGAQYLPQVGGGDTFLWSSILDLESVFEMFVGAFLERFLLGRLSYHPVLEFQRRLTVAVDRSIVRPRQDWVLRTNMGTSCVVDAKYKKLFTPEADSEALEVAPAVRVKTADIFQLQAYLSHAESTSTAVGIMAYPSTAPFVAEIKGFRNRLYAVGMPVVGAELQQSWHTLSEEVSKKI